MPDWPLSFGTVFPRMVGGVRYEHTHRIIAGVVLLLTVTLTGWIWRRDGLSAEGAARPRLVRLSLAALGAVLLQASLGGATVLFRLPPAISVAHAALAQIFFALAVALAVLTAPTAVRRGASPSASLHQLYILTALAIYLQTLLGAIIRHTGSALVIPDFPLAFGRLIPPMESARIAVQFAHRVGALVVAGLILASVAAAFRFPSPAGRPLAAALGALLIAQVGLGAGIIWTLRAVPVSTAHVAVGALLFGTSVWLALISRPPAPQS